jgi:REP element-mobilizing transposase RayT
LDYRGGGYDSVRKFESPILCTDTSRVFLRTAIRECRQRWPFLIDAMVLLDNRLHAILIDDLSDDKPGSMDDAPQLMRMAG